MSLRRALARTARITGPTGHATASRRLGSQPVRCCFRLFARNPRRPLWARPIIDRVVPVHRALSRIAGGLVALVWGAAACSSDDSPDTYQPPAACEPGETRACRGQDRCE